MNRVLAAFALALAASAVLHAEACKSNALPRRSDWPVYGGQGEGDHYSPLSQINRGNVRKLKEAWKFDAAEEGGLETSPIIIGRTLFDYTASQKVIALEASTGKLLWKFDSGLPSKQPARGLAYWTDGRQGRVLAGRHVQPTTGPGWRSTKNAVSSTFLPDPRSLISTEQIG